MCINGEVMSEKNKRFGAAIAIFENNNGILRMADAVKLGITRYTLYAMRDAGIVEALSRGVYRLDSISGMTNPDLAAVASRAPEGIICLISALAFHNLTTQIPHAIDVAIQRDTWIPQFDYPPINVYKFSGDAYSSGIHLHKIDGVKVNVYSPEKSVADIFKYRNKLGMDVALEALQMWSERSGRDINALMKYAKVCRVDRVMRPYIAALI